ncbi:MAG: hypothetical protein ACOX37_11660 [Bacillota bacterium]
MITLAIIGNQLFYRRQLSSAGEFHRRNNWLLHEGEGKMEGKIRLVTVGSTETVAQELLVVVREMFPS